MEMKIRLETYKWATGVGASRITSISPYAPTSRFNSLHILPAAEFINHALSFVSGIFSSPFLHSLLDTNIDVVLDKRRQLQRETQATMLVALHALR